jgi:hypothetical protein
MDFCLGSRSSVSREILHCFINDSLAVSHGAISMPLLLQLRGLYVPILGSSRCLARQRKVERAGEGGGGREMEREREREREARGESEK